MLTSAKQIPPAILNQRKLQLIVAASGYETRARFFSESYAAEQSCSKIAFGFGDRKLLARATNDHFFRSNGFEMIDGLSGDTDATIVAELEARIRNLAENHDIINIAVDISSMTKCWYSGVIKTLARFDLPGKCIRCYFNYTPSDYSPPPTRSVNSVVGVLPGYCNLASVDLPVALIIGMGYDRVRGAGLREYIDPAKTVLFYTNPTYDERFTGNVLENNRTLIENVERQLIFPHPIWDLDYTLSKLVDVVSDLSRNYRVIIAPLGVKPFALLAMLTVLRYESADLWRVSGSTKSTPLDRKPLGSTLLLEVVFGKLADTQTGPGR